MKKLQNESHSYINKVDAAIKKCYINNPSNEELMSLYLEIGNCICEQGEKAFISHLADFIKINHSDVKGFSPRNLRRMRELSEFYSQNQNSVKIAVTLSFTVNCVILENTETKEEIMFYLKLAQTKSLSKLKLIQAIKSNTFDERFEENEDNITEKGNILVVLIKKFPRCSVKFTSKYWAEYIPILYHLLL